MDALSIGIVFVQIALAFVLLIALMICIVMVYRRKHTIQQTYWFIFYFIARPFNIFIGFIIGIISIFTSTSPSEISNKDIAINCLSLLFSFLFSYCQYLTQHRWSRSVYVHGDYYDKLYNKHIIYPMFALVDILVYIILVTFNKDDEAIYRLYSIIGLTIYQITVYIDWTVMFYCWQSKEIFSRAGLRKKTRQKMIELYGMDLLCIFIMMIMMSLLLIIHSYPNIDETNDEIFGKFMKTIANSVCPLIAATNLLYRTGIEEEQKPFKMAKNACLNCQWSNYQRNQDRNDSEPTSNAVTTQDDDRKDDFLENDGSVNQTSITPLN